MANNILFGLGRYLIPIQPFIWQKQVQSRVDLGFMTVDHHRVRNFVVLALPQAGKPLSSEVIAQALNLPLERVFQILDELEKRKTFLFRDEHGAVSWAYPVTVDPTPHLVSLSSGEQIYAA